MMECVAVNPAGVAATGSHYSHSVRVESADGALVFVSGQIARGPDGEPVGIGDVVAQSEQVFRNLEVILAAHGATLAHVVRIGTYLVNGVDRNEFGAVRERYLPAPPPASTLIYVSALAGEQWLVEVDAVAAVPKSA